MARFGSQIPPGWEVRSLEELQSDEPSSITDGPFGSNLTSAHYTDLGARVVRLTNIGDGIFNDAHAYISMAHFGSLRRHEVLAGDLLIASLGQILPLACIAPSTLGPAIVKADCIRARLSPRVDARWVMYAMQTPELRRWAQEHSHGVGRPRLGLKVIRRLPIPLPPLAMQRQLVEILDDHLSRVDAGSASLVRVQRELELLEGGVLGRCAVGTLTPLEDVAQIQGGIQKQPRRVPKDNAYPFLRVANVTPRGLDLDDVHRIELFGEELERLRLRRGDLLVVEGNGSASQIGRAATWDASIPDCVHQNHLIRVRANDSVSPAYLEAVWNSPNNRRQLTTLASSSSGLYTLSVAKLKSLSIPVPSKEQQERVVTQVDEVRRHRSRLEASLTGTRIRAAGLRRALLSAAFSGRLTGTGPVNGVFEELASV